MFSAPLERNTGNWKNPHKYIRYVVYQVGYQVLEGNASISTPGTLVPGTGHIAHLLRLQIIFSMWYQVPGTAGCTGIPGTQCTHNIVEI